MCSTYMASSRPFPLAVRIFSSLRSTLHFAHQTLVAHYAKWPEVLSSLVTTCRLLLAGHCCYVSLCQHSTASAAGNLLVYMLRASLAMCNYSTACRLTTYSSDCIAFAAAVLATGDIGYRLVQKAISTQSLVIHQCTLPGHLIIALATGGIYRQDWC